MVTHMSYQPEMDEETRTRLIREFDPDEGDESPSKRARALGYLRRHDCFPFRLSNGDWVVDGEEDTWPEDGRTFIADLTTVTERECPECGYDRAERRFWSDGMNNALVVECRACGHDIENHPP